MKQQFEDYYNEYILQEENLNNMNENQLKTLLTTLLGPDGLDIKKAEIDWKNFLLLKLNLFMDQKLKIHTNGWKPLSKLP